MNGHGEVQALESSGSFGYDYGVESDMRKSTHQGDSSAHTHQFGLCVSPSPETNDFEVKIFLNDEDVIDKRLGMLGLDPDELLTSTRLLAADKESRIVTVARCGGCGVVGCGSVRVSIRLHGGCVVWDAWEGNLRKWSPETFRFDPICYSRELERATADRSWETPDRTAARLFASLVDVEILKQHALSFDWVSGLIRANMFTVSLRLTPGPFQLLVHTAWNDETPQAIAAKAWELLQLEPQVWPSVEWCSQNGNSSAIPPVAGFGWRKYFPNSEAT